MTATNDPFVERYKLPGVPLPLLDDDIANKAYVDSMSGGGMSELEFLQEKDAAGKLRNVTGQGTTVAAHITIVPPIATTTVLVSCGYTIDPTAAQRLETDVKVNGVVISRQRSAYPIGIGHYIPFVGIKGKQLIGDGVKSITVNIIFVSAAGNLTTFSLEAYDL